MKKTGYVLLCVLLVPVMLFTACGPKQWSSPPSMSIDPSKEYQATIKTNFGDIVVQLFPEDAPLAVNNFVFLARPNNQTWGQNDGH